MPQRRRRGAGFEGSGGLVADAGVPASGVVPAFDPFEDRGGELGPGGPGAPGRGARVARWTRSSRSWCCRRSWRPCPCCRAARPHAAGARRSRTWIATRGRCAGPWSPGRGGGVPAGHLQGVDDELAAEVVGDGPAHDHAGPHVQDRAAVDLPLTGGVLGDVGAPQPVRAVGGELALHQIVVHGCRRRGPAGLPRGWIPCRPTSLSSRATRSRLTTRPRPRVSSACTRGAP